jgi:class 3 adenylate cyclase/TolB-like protein/ketosteroid isomerase-like protein
VSPGVQGAPFYLARTIGYNLAVDPPGETYTRRVCAVLLADVSGFSTFMGEDDERAARAVDELRKVVQGIVADTQGRVEPVAGDAFFATFDSVVAAVDAAIRIQRRIAGEDFAGRRLRIRIGVHLGDLLLREGSAFGDAINVAARLQTLARPGTICISDGVYRHVRRRFDERFEDLGRQRLKNISDPVHAYLIVPQGVGERRSPRARRWLVRGAAPAVALALVAAVVVLYARRRPGPPPAPSIIAVERVGKAAPEPAPENAAPSEKVALGVMLFKPLGDDADTAWMREALRDGLNTQLSELSQVKVYSKEFIDFLITRQGLSEIEAATKLGVKKMLSGSFVKVGDKLRIETHVVDVATGVLESSASTVGRQQDFVDLQAKMVMEVIARLNLPVTADERKLLLTRRNTDVDAMKLLLEAEGGGAAPPAPPGPGSVLWPLDPASVLAAESPEAAKADILAVLERYRQATEAREIQALAAVYLEFPPEQQAAQQRYFENVKDLKVAIENADVAVVGDEAVVSYTRTDHFDDAKTGRPMQVSIRLTKILKRQDGAWKLAGGK